MQFQSRSRRILLITGVFFLLLIVFAIYLISHRPKQPKTTVYKDPLSHQTVTDIAGKTPETSGSNSDLPIYLGFDRLTESGLTFDQVAALKQAFYKYSKTQLKPIGEISIDVDHITSQHNPKVHNSPFVLLFTVRFNRTTDYRAKVEYHGINDVRLYLIDPRTGTVFFDSGTTLQEGIGD